MNGLSWFLYFADVCSSIVNVTIILCFCGFVFLAITGMGFDCDEDWRRIARKIGPWLIVAVFVACFLPSKDTFYAIAASEYGEEVLKSPEASKARAALDAWLDKQLTPEKGK